MNCRDCEFWVWDPGMWTMTGWTGMDREDGHCHLEQKVIRKDGNDFCGRLRPKIKKQII